MDSSSFIATLKTHGNDFLNPITLVNVSTIDQPLIYVNDKFTQLTGYTAEEVLGKNCRFLQNGQADPKALNKIREAIHNGKPVCQDLLNFRKDGVPFYNRLLLLPFRQDDLYYIGLQNEIPKEKFKQTFEGNDLTLLDKGFNALSVFYSSILLSHEETSLSKLKSTFERIRDLIQEL